MWIYVAATASDRSTVQLKTRTGGRLSKKLLERTRFVPAHLQLGRPITKHHIKKRLQFWSYGSWQTVPKGQSLDFTHTLIVRSTGELQVAPNPCHPGNRSENLPSRALTISDTEARSPAGSTSASQAVNTCRKHNSTKVPVYPIVSPWLSSGLTGFCLRSWSRWSFLVCKSTFWHQGNNKSFPTDGTGQDNPPKKPKKHLK